MCIVLFMKVKSVNSLDTNSLIKINIDSVVIDVRSSKEWEERGIPQIEPPLILLTWRLLPNMIINQDFEKTLINQIPDKTKNLFFLCKSGVRSLEAANFVAKLGYINCHNISDGFEGSSSGLGWKNNNLPWQTL